MLTVGFIFPSSEYLHDPFRGDPHTHFQILTVLESHFGDQLNLSLIDLRGIKKHFALYHIPECDVYLHSVYTLDYAEQVSIVEGLRERYPTAKHIAGGPHAVEFQEECLRTFDALVIGDGEELIVRAIADVMQSKLKAIYKQESAVDINLYPFPSRRYLPEATIARRGLIAVKKKQDYKDLLSTTVIFSRGCPYKCHFCHMPRTKEYGLGIRYRRPAFIEQEIEYLKREYHIGAISLLDEICIPLNRAKAIEHLEAIGRTGVVWKGQCRVDGITPELAKLARQAGCVIMGLGVESVSQRALDIINKRINVAQARDTIRLLKQNDIEVRIYMIIGLPSEPEDIVDQTWSFIEDAEPDLVHLSLFTVRPGTVIYDNPEQFGIKHIRTDWEDTMHMFGRYEHETPALTFEYEEQTPWGKGLSKERIVNNYMELQRRLKEHGLCTP